MPEILTALVARFGYLTLFVGVALESAGIPLPAEALLLAASFAAHHGLLHLPAVIGVAALAAVLGDNLGYLAGRRGGRPFVARHGPRVGLTAPRLAAIEGLLERHGAQAVFLARFVTGVRVFAAVAAGVAGVPWGAFLAWNVAGALAWSLLVGLAGYLAGHGAVVAGHALGRAGGFAAAVLSALGVAALAWRYGRRLVGPEAARTPAGLGFREVLIALGHTVGLATFAWIAEAVVHRQTTAIDEALALGIHAFASPALDAAMRLLTRLGDLGAVVAVVVAVSGWALQRGDRRAAATLVSVALAETTLNTLLKLAFERERPDLWSLVATLQSYSFPSGHAMAATAVYGLAAVVAARLAPRARPLLGVAAPLLILGIGFSRVYLGVHWPTDVLAGFAAGAVLLLAGVYLMGGSAVRQRGEDVV